MILYRALDVAHGILEDVRNVRSELFRWFDRVDALTEVAESACDTSWEVLPVLQLFLRRPNVVA